MLEKVHDSDRQMIRVKNLQHSENYRTHDEGVLKAHERLRWGTRRRGIGPASTMDTVLEVLAMDTRVGVIGLGCMRITIAHEDGATSTFPQCVQIRVQRKNHRRHRFDVFCVNLRMSQRHGGITTGSY